jgi:hypothetical protein
MLDRRAGDVPELGRRRARQHRVDAHALVGQLVLQALAEGQDEGLAAPVDAVEDFRPHRHDRGDVDQGPATARHEARNGGVGQAGQDVDVQRQHPAHVLDIGLQQRRGGADAGVVDQGGDALVVAQHLLHPGEVGAIGQVGGQDLDLAARLGGDPAGHGVQPRAVAGDQDQVVAALGQPVGIDRADAGRSAGDQGEALVLIAHLHSSETVWPDDGGCTPPC